MFLQRINGGEISHAFREIIVRFRRRLFFFCFGCYEPLEQIVYFFFFHRDGFSALRDNNILCYAFVIGEGNLRYYCKSRPPHKRISAGNFFSFSILGHSLESVSSAARSSKALSPICLITKSSGARPFLNPLISVSLINCVVDCFMKRLNVS